MTLTWEARSARSSSATIAEGCPRDCTPSRHRRSATSRCCGIAVLSDDSPAVSMNDSSVGCGNQYAIWRPLAGKCIGGALHRDTCDAKRQRIEARHGSATRPLTERVLHERLAGGGQLGAQVGAGAHAAAAAVQQQVVRHRRLGLVPPPQRVQQRPPLEAQPLHLQPKFRFVESSLPQYLRTVNFKMVDFDSRFRLHQTPSLKRLMMSAAWHCNLHWTTPRRRCRRRLSRSWRRCPPASPPGSVASAP
jgi:hypothetical protein